MEETNINNENNKPQFAVFDWIVSLPVIRIIKPIYEWKKAFWIYCVLGFLSTLSNFVLAYVFSSLLKLTGGISNLLAWILSTVFSFVLYRYFYFDRTNNSFLNELIKFASSRLFTFGVEEVSVILLVDVLGVDMMIVKVIMIPVTALLNYITSKFFVFKKK